MTTFSPLSLWPPFGSGVLAEPEPVTATFLEALRTRLLEIPSLSDLTDVYLTTSPPHAEFPYLVINRLYQTPFINTSESYYKEVGVQFTVFSLDDFEAGRLGDAAYDALLPTTANPPLEFTEGYEMTRLQGQSHGPTSENWGMPAGDIVWRHHFDYTWLIGSR